MNARIYEAQRLLRRIDDRDADCARWLIQAIEQLAAADPAMPVKYALLHINNALPGAGLSAKEKEFLQPANEARNN